MARIRTVDFLPEIFKTETNRKLLGATLDQLVQEPKFKKTQGYIGRKFGAGVNANDGYVVEPDKTRQDYQFEPGIVFLKENTQEAADAITYPGLLDDVSTGGGNVEKADQLFVSESYSWDPFINFDKFVNFSQYYWLPNGPDPVDVSGSDVPLTDEYTVVKNSSYMFSGIAGNNPTLTLARGGTYTFEINQDSQFWVQSVLGTSGVLLETPNLTSRDVYGVVNNGSSSGTVTFNIPKKSDQDFYFKMPTTTSVDLVVDSWKFDQLNGMFLSELISEYNGIDGLADLNNRTLVFLDRSLSAEQGGWFYRSKFDAVIRTAAPTDPDLLNGALGSFDVESFDQSTAITDLDLRYGVWRISYVYDSEGKNPYINLTPLRTINKLNKFQILYGNEYGNIYFFRESNGYIRQLPQLTAQKDILYYQDSNDPTIFGTIFLVDQEGQSTIIIDDILGKTTYTAPNRVKFTNGLKVQFRGNTIPSDYENQTYYVNGVGESIELLPTNLFVTPENYTESGQEPYDVDGFDSQPFDLILNQPLSPDYITIGLSSKDLNAWTRSNRWFHIDVIQASATYNNTTASLNNDVRAKRPIIEFNPGLRLINMGSEGIPPINVIDFLETDAFSNINGKSGYSVDGYNFISGSTVIFAADTDPLVVNQIYSIDFVDISAGAPVSSRSYISDGSTSVYSSEGLGVVSDQQLLVKINGTTQRLDTDYTVNVGARTITFGNPPTDNSTVAITRIPIINLVSRKGGRILDQQNVTILNGNILQGHTYWFQNSQWSKAQQKNSRNQAPLFDMFNDNDISFSDQIVYPSSTFSGTTLFSYAVGSTGPTDSVLGFPLRYLNINNVGDIVFENNLYLDRFISVDGGESKVTDIDTGYIKQFNSRINFVRRIGWQPSLSPVQSTQIITLVYDPLQPLRIDIVPKLNTRIPSVKVFLDNIYLDPSNYSYSVDIDRQQTTFTLNPLLEVGISVQFEIISDQVSRIGKYQIPDNLEFNPFNENATEFTLGTIRTHFNTIGQNINNLIGNINGSSNIRDLGNIIPYGQKLVQNSSPVTMMGVFSRSADTDLLSSIDYSAREYEKYKNLIATSYKNNDYGFDTPADILNTIIRQISVGRDVINPFYWTDMLPNGSAYQEITYSITAITSDTFDTLRSYDLKNANYSAILVYLDDVQLVRGVNYLVADDGPRITVLTDLAIGQKLKIREYTDTSGSFVPATPTKLGLYPSYIPEIYVDTTYVTPAKMIRGHDGSLTVAFDDGLDDVLLEFEKRIYNNLKVSDSPPLLISDVMPGQFRDTGYSQQAIVDILASNFLSWVGWNRLNYKTQDFVANNPFTWNYSTATSKLDGSLLLGFWRGIYSYYYDTDSPHNRPWEMLGFANEPIWWRKRYGPAPYTSGNLVLWKDLENGFVADPSGSYTLDRYQRPGLLSVIPSDSEGNLRAPVDVIVKNYDFNQFRKSWTVGDDAPVEASWRKSSSYPYAIQKLLILARPAKYYALNSDRDLYKYNTEFKQFLYKGRFRLDPSGIDIYGAGIAKHSYINFIVDYNQQKGIDSQALIQSLLRNFDVRLCYRMAAFTDKKYVKIFIEKTSPNSTNTSFLVPEESHDLLIYKNQTFDTVIYSSVMVQRVEDGFVVVGNSITQPYFTIDISVVNGNFGTIAVGNQRVRISKDFQDLTVRVPYNFKFSTVDGIVDFLNSYGHYLERKGMQFDSVNTGTVINWNQMIFEFLLWNQQEWEIGSAINLNPAARTLKINRPRAVAQSLANNGTPALLDINRRMIDPKTYVVDRIENELTIRMLGDSSLGYARLEFTSYETLLILDNVSAFADLIYKPVTGDRQSRVKLIGNTTFEWNGLVDAQGFILNEDNIKEWRQNQKYTKGQIVLYKNEYWSAAKVIEPSANFDFSKWIKSDFALVNKGLLPNLANKAKEITRYYDNKSAVLTRDADLLSFGLVGFRPREYMASLGLDDVSQQNLYSSFLKNKGTRLSVESISRANLGKEVADYRIYENWAVRKATYGGNANRNYFEIAINPRQIDSNPSVIAIVIPGQETEANQLVYLNELYKQSIKYSDTNILPSTFDSASGLPNAGYVNEDDVDIKVFDLTNFRNQVSQQEIRRGTNIWAARINDYDWNIYRATRTPVPLILIEDNLDGRTRMTFNGFHGLTPNDFIVIRFFNPTVNGSYQVVSVPDLSTITVNFSILGNRSSIVGDGVVFKLLSVRVAQPSDIVNLSFADDLVGGDKVWVDKDQQGRWTVLEKTQPFSSVIDTLQPTSTETDLYFGADVAQTRDTLVTINGAPGYDNGAGAIFNFSRTEVGFYEPKAIIDMSEWQNTPGTLFEGIGNAVDIADGIGDNIWAVAGASASLADRGAAIILSKANNEFEFSEYQALLDPLGVPDDEYGYSVAISRDSYWVYVGAPGANKIFAYQQVEVQDQLVTYLGDGSTLGYSFDSVLVINAEEEIAVFIDDEEKEYTIDYTVDLEDKEIIFDVAPVEDTVVKLQRRRSKTEVGDGSTVDFFLQGSNDDKDIYTAINEYSIKVKVNNVYQRAGVDYIMPATGVVRFLSAPGAGEQIEFESVDYYQLIGNITVSGLSASSRFGHSVTCTTDGNQLIVGCPGYAENIGRVYVFDRSAETTVILDDDDDTVSMIRVPSGEPVVYVNNVLQRDAAWFNDGTYLITSLGIDFFSETPVTDPDSGKIAVGLDTGDSVVIETNNFSLIQIIDTNETTGPTGETLNGSLRAAKFGWSVDQCPTNCSVYVGAPDSYRYGTQQGLVERHVNQARAYGSILSTDVVTSVTIGNSVRINGVNITFTGTTLDSVVQDINDAANVDLLDSNDSAEQAKYKGLSNVVASSVGGKLRVSVIDTTPTRVFDRLQVLPGLSNDPDTGLQELKLEPYAWTQSLQNPVPTDYGEFGHKVFIDSEADSLVIGAPNSDRKILSTWINDGVSFDGNSTRFFDHLPRTGTAYTYDYLPSYNESIENPGKFVFGQQVYSELTREKDRFGSSLSYINGVLLIGAPESSDLSIESAGSVSVFDNTNKMPSWKTIRQQLTSVKTDLINSIYLYDTEKQKVVEYLDWIDPLRGKVLGVAERNIDFVGAIDPAAYNEGVYNNYGQTWRSEHLGKIWWNTSRSRFLNYDQGTAIYASRIWGTLFPGSSIDVYQWVESSEPPLNYTGPGVPWSITNYSTSAKLNDAGTFTAVYYFWVSNVDTIYSEYGKTLSIKVISEYIANPRNSGIAFMAALQPNVVALYNILPTVQQGNTILHVEYDRIKNDTPVHVEYELIPENKASGFLSDNLYRKFVDSLSGSDSIGNTVPDPDLNPSDRYGVDFRPRQSMVRDRFLALKNYIDYTNSVLSRFTVSEFSTFSLLNSAEPFPSPDDTLRGWNKRVSNLTELGYQNLNLVGAGYRYLVETDSNNRGLWTIYEVAGLPTVEYIVTVAGPQGSDTGNKYILNGIYKPTLDFQIGYTYVFNQNNQTNVYWPNANGTTTNPHPLNFSADNLSGERGGGTSYLTNVQYFLDDVAVTQAVYVSAAFNMATARQVRITVTSNTPTTLYYWCYNHSAMGNNILVSASVSFESAKSLELIAVQTYDTLRYWSYVDWYAPGASRSIKPSAEILVAADLATLSLLPGSFAKITANAEGKWEIYRYETDGTWTRVAVQSGTVQISDIVYDYSKGNFGFDSEVFDNQYFDQEPIVETRRIIQAINQELLIGDLLIERNRALTLMFNYVLSEQLTSDWLIKTSLIDVDHVLRRLEPFDLYNKDNQDFVRKYIQEIKPYHTQIREFNLSYVGLDQFQGDITDFDVPAFWNSSLQTYVSPVLDDTLITPSSYNDSDPIWQTLPYDQWYNNYKLRLSSVSMIASGSGYTVPPEVLISGSFSRPPELRPKINSLGQVYAIDVIDAGAGYVSTLGLTLVGGNGSGARATAIMVVEQVRSMKTTIKYDRYQYQASLTDWQANTAYNNNVRVRFDDQVYQADCRLTIRVTKIGGNVLFYDIQASDLTDYAYVIEAVVGEIQSVEIQRNGVNLSVDVDFNYALLTTTLTRVVFVADSVDASSSGPNGFDPTQWTLVDVSNLSGVDRTMGLYNPTLSRQGLQLSLLISGVEYPGVQVYGKGWEIDDPTSLMELDAVYESKFQDTYLGIRPADINVVGGEFVDVYHSYAPEELIPGAMFDTLDLKVYTRPGADWTGRGHGWPSDSFIYEVTDTRNIFSFGNSRVRVPAVIIVKQLTSGFTMYENIYYTVDWKNKTINLITGAGSGNFISIEVYGFGGGNQIYRQSILGSDLVGDYIIVPVKYDPDNANNNELYDVVIFRNGHRYTNFIYEKNDDFSTKITINGASEDDYFAILVNGLQTPQYSYSIPEQQVFAYDGSTRSFTLARPLSGYNLTSSTVEVNGYRLRPPSTFEYIGDGTTVYFDTEFVLDIPPESIIDDEVTISIDGVTLDPDSQSFVGDGNTFVYRTSNVSVPLTGAVEILIDGTELIDDFTVINLDPVEIYFYTPPAAGSQIRIFGKKYILEPWDGSTIYRTVWIFDTPADGSIVQVSVWTRCDYQVVDNHSTLLIDNTITIPINGQIGVLSYNDAVQQKLLTRTFLGSQADTPPFEVGFDDVPFDFGSFDEAQIFATTTTNFNLGRKNINPGKLVVTVNGISLIPGDEFIVLQQENESILVLSLPNLVVNDVIVVTMRTNFETPNSIAFRVFHDMRDNRLIYRITDSSSTSLTQPLSISDGVITVKDASALSAPDPESGVFGFVTINGERITYLSRNTATNTLSNLRRGTVGTGVTSHAAGSIVTDTGKVNQLALRYQDADKFETFIGNGSIASFTASTLAVADQRAVIITVGGRILSTGYTITSTSPITVVLSTVPQFGEQVKISVLQSEIFYAPGTSTPSDGLSLQSSNTLAARFIRDF